MSGLNRSNMGALLVAARAGLDAMHAQMTDAETHPRSRDNRRQIKELKARFYAAWEAYDELAERFGASYYTPNSGTPGYQRRPD